MAYQEPDASAKEDAKIKRIGVIVLVVIILILAGIFRESIHNIIYPTHEASAPVG